MVGHPQVALAVEGDGAWLAEGIWPLGVLHRALEIWVGDPAPWAVDGGIEPQGEGRRGQADKHRIGGGSERGGVAARRGGSATEREGRESGGGFETVIHHLLLPIFRALYLNPQLVTRPIGDGREPCRGRASFVYAQDGGAVQYKAVV